MFMQAKLTPPAPCKNPGEAPAVPGGIPIGKQSSSPFPDPARVSGSNEHPDQHSRTCPHSILPLSPFLQAFLIFSSRKQHSVLSGAAHVSHTRVIFSFSPRKEQIIPSLMQLKRKNTSKKGVWFFKTKSAAKRERE